MGLAQLARRAPTSTLPVGLLQKLERLKAGHAAAPIGTLRSTPPIQHGAQTSSSSSGEPSKAVGTAFGA